MLHSKRTSPSAWIRSVLGYTNRPDLTEQLNEAHRALADHVSGVPMRYTDAPSAMARVWVGWEQVCEGVHQTLCQLPTTRCTILNVRFEPGAFIPRHDHPEHDEEVVVVEGDILDEDTGVRTDEGGIYIIPKEQPHTIKAGPGGALVNVVFRPQLSPIEIETACHKRPQ